MKIINFKYEKDLEKSKRTLLVLNENSENISGIDFTKLSQDEITEVKIIQEEYEKKLKPFIVKGFRNFSKTKIVEDKDASS